MDDHRAEEKSGGTGIEESGKIPFEIVAAYEDSAARERTMSLCRRLEEQLGNDCAFKCAWWGLENLGDARLREQAASEAAEAKMIIISLRDQQELPRVLKAWCESWADRRRGHKAALVALVAGTEPAGQTVGSVQRGLELLARRTHLDFFVHWFDTGSGSATGTRTRTAGSEASPIDSRAQTISFRQPTPRWGINE
jgi:hypothetical protein